jgi:hypothetical protein
MIPAGSDAACDARGAAPPVSIAPIADGWSSPVLNARHACKAS